MFHFAGEFVVHKASFGTRSFQSAVTDKYICVTADGINCKVSKFIITIIYQT